MLPPRTECEKSGGVGDVNTNTVYRRKVIFYSGSYFNDMLSKATVEKLVAGKDVVLPNGNGSGNGGSTGGGSGSDGNENPLG